MNILQLRFYDQLDSTQSEAKRLLKSGKAMAGMVIQAGSQTGGHGRHNRKWTSPSGNAYLTIILKKPENPIACGDYSFLTALAVADTVAQYQPHKSIRLKWPNDVLVQGQKIAGILLEVEGDWLLVGIGLNVASAPDDAAHIGAHVDVNAVIRVLLDHFVAWQVRYSLGGFGFIRENWLLQAVGLGMPLSCKLQNSTICGVFSGLDEQGALLLELADGQIKPIYSGEVFF